MTEALVLAFYVLGALLAYEWTDWIGLVEEDSHLRQRDRVNMSILWPLVVVMWYVATAMDWMEEAGEP